MGKKIIGYYRSCDIVTMLSTVFAITGIILAINHHIITAVSCLILCGICDAFDGVLARRRENTKDETIYGEELDSLSDMMAFGVLPIMITICDGMNKICYYPIFIFYILCGLIRLAYFNMLAQKKDTDKNHFIGIPITSITIIYPIFYIAFRLTKVDFSELIMVGMLFVTGICYIIRIKVKKPDSKIKAVLAVIGLIIVIMFGIFKYFK